MQHDAAKEYLRAFCREDSFSPAVASAAAGLETAQKAVSSNPFRLTAPLEII